MSNCPSLEKQSQCSFTKEGHLASLFGPLKLIFIGLLLANRFQDTLFCD